MKPFRAGSLSQETFLVKMADIISIVCLLMQGYAKKTLRNLILETLSNLKGMGSAGWIKEMEKWSSSTRADHSNFCHIFLFQKILYLINKKLIFPDYVYFFSHIK